VTGVIDLVLLGDVDLLVREAEDPESRQRLRRMGFEVEGLPRVVAARDRLARAIDRRWIVTYERARQRYGRGIAAVRERVCQGCYVTLPTSVSRQVVGTGPNARPGPPGLCASCGRILYWG